MYTGEVSAPIYFRGRPLWRITYKYDLQPASIAHQVRQGTDRLLDSGQAEIYLPIPAPPAKRGWWASGTYDDSQGILQIPSSEQSEWEGFDPELPVQFDRYCLTVRDYQPPTATVAGSVQFVNMPPDLGPPFYFVQDTGIYSILVHPERPVQPRIEYEPGGRFAMIEDIRFVEVP